MEKILQITKAPIAKIWHVLKAKAIAALEKYVSVSTFAHEYNPADLSILSNINLFFKLRV